MLELKPFKKEDLKVHYAFLQMPRAMIDEEMNQFDYKDILNNLSTISKYLFHTLLRQLISDILFKYEKN